MGKAPGNGRQALQRCVSGLAGWARWLAVLLALVSMLASADNSSRSLLLSQDKTRLISANFDAGSVSLIDRHNGKLLQEQTIGRDIRRIAVSDEPANARLLASDYLGSQLVLLNADTLDILKRIPVPARPFGVVFNPRTRLFYATSFEQGLLLVLDLDGDLLFQLPTAPTPRGLALTDDQRLLVTHALTGQVSIFDVSGTQPQLSKVLQLADSPAQAARTDSQGKPRLLDNIAIAPDGETAWLPHVLWSFGHDFQFQSSVFPAVSLLDLTPGHEQELIEERKQLFVQINITENANKTRIVSNPHEAVFTPSGDKVIVSLAGSEDLMVFDLSRQGTENKKRHRRKKFQGGAKVTQIYRHVPGDNPQGLVIDGEELLVQNAMSLNLVSFDIGQPGPFSRLTLRHEHFASLVSLDPVDPLRRLGKTLFNRANTDADPQYPMTGDFWMSCNSCHLDGFNFTNKALMQDAQKNRFENAVTGHVDAHKMIAGNPVQAYIEIIQKTQGGMEAVDPAAPSPAVVHQMQALDDYVRAPENLPYLSTWLRLDDSRRYTHPKDWVNSAKCAACHTHIYDQWADSNHGMNMDHPFYRFQEDLAAAEEGEEFRVLCRGCHAPQLVFNKDNAPLKGHGDLYEKNSQSLATALETGQPVSERGTGCLFCHRITKAENAGGNTDLTVNLKDRETYVFEDAGVALFEWFADRQINALPGAHKASYSNPALYQDSLYCATCHNEFTPGMGANINDNYGEWLASPFNRPDDPARHKTCIDCHMTTAVKDFDQNAGGQSTNDGPQKSRLRAHHFTGGNYYFTGMRNPEHRQQSIDLLQHTLTLELAHEGRQLMARITNKNSGHDMPGGSRRQVWLELEVTDSQGQTVLQSGKMQNGVIPPNSRKFEKIAVDNSGSPVGLRFWRYTRIAKDTRIKSGATREEVFTLPQTLNYPIQVSARVLYQVFSQAATEQVQAAYPEQKIPVPEVIEMVKATQVFVEAPSP